MSAKLSVVVLTCSILGGCEPFVGVDCTGLGASSDVRVELLESYSEASQYTYVNGETFEDMEGVPSCESLGSMPATHDIRVGDSRGQGGSSPLSACLTYAAELQVVPPFEIAVSTEVTYGLSSVAGLQGDLAATYNRTVGPDCVAREFFYVSVWPGWEHAANPEADRPIFGVAVTGQAPPAIALRRVYFSGSDCSMVPDELVGEGCFDVWAAQVDDLTTE